MSREQKRKSELKKMGFVDGGSGSFKPEGKNNFYITSNTIKTASNEMWEILTSSFKNKK